MADTVTIRRLGAADLRDFKALRDTMLERHPEAFTSDAPTEGHRRADDYLPRLGLDRTEGGHLTLGAWRAGELVGAIGLDRDPRPKVRHIGQVVGMMVLDPAQRLGIGQRLLAALIGVARARVGLEQLTLTVTEGNTVALHLYERAGFERYGQLRNAVKVGSVYHAKVHMVKFL